jgi:hypothetical protein
MNERSGSLRFVRQSFPLANNLVVKVFQNVRFWIDNNNEYNEEELFTLEITEGDITKTIPLNWEVEVIGCLPTFKILLVETHGQWFPPERVWINWE